MAQIDEELRALSPYDWSGTVNVRVERNVHAILKDLANNNHVSVSQVINHLLKRQLAQYNIKA